MMAFLKERDRAERWFIAGTVTLFAAIAANGMSRTAVAALGFASAAQMLVGYGLGIREIFFRSGS